mgnify:CR=1 FL=1
MANAKEIKTVLFGPVFANNPIALQVLGICSALAVTTKMDKALVMCIALTLVTAFSNFFISLIRNHIPSSVRIIVQMTIIASLVIVVDQLLKAFAYEVAKSAEVLILTGENASEKVSQVFSVEPFYHTTSISSNNYTKDLLNQKNLVVFNGLNDIPSGLSTDLKEFHEKGGTVFVIPGNQINRSDYAEFLSGIELPALGDLMSDGLKLDDIRYKDPFFIGVFEKENQALNLPNVRKAYRVNASNGLNFIYHINIYQGKNANNAHIVKEAWSLPTMQKAVVNAVSAESELA